MRNGGSLDRVIACRHCGVDVYSPKGAVSVCPKCRRKAKRAAERRNRKVREARLRTVQVEKIDRMAVFKRDRWRCHLCLGPINPALIGSSDDAAPTLDHVVPIAGGGDHTYTNIAAAHRICNSYKCDTR